MSVPGFLTRLRRRSLRSIVHISPDGELLAYRSFFDKFDSILDVTTAFGGAGYFYQDKFDRLVTGMPDGHVVAWRRVTLGCWAAPSTNSCEAGTSRWIEPDGPVPSTHWQLLCRVCLTRMAISGLRPLKA